MPLGHGVNYIQVFPLIATFKSGLGTGFLLRLFRLKAFGGSAFSFVARRCCITGRSCIGDRYATICIGCRNNTLGCNAFRGKIFSSNARRSSVADRSFIICNSCRSHAACATFETSAVSVAPVLPCIFWASFSNSFNKTAGFIPEPAIPKAQPCPNNRSEPSTACS